MSQGTEYDVECIIDYSTITILLSYEVPVCHVVQEGRTGERKGTLKLFGHLEAYVCLYHTHSPLIQINIETGSVENGHTRNPVLLCPGGLMTT